METTNYIIMLSFNGDKERKFNLPQSLSYANMTRYYDSFSYQEKYLSPELKEEIKKNPSNIKNKEGILCMKIQSGKFIIPIWKIKILDCEIREKTFFFKIRLDKLINHINNKNIEDYSSIFKKNEFLAESIENSIFNNISINSNKDTWFDIIEKLSKTTLEGLEYCKTTLFYRLIEIEKYRGFFSRFFTLKERGKNKIVITPKELNKEGDYGYQLLPGSQYNIKIFHKIFMANEYQQLKEFNPINLEGPFKPDLSILSQEINSKYRDHSYLVRTTEEKSAIQEIRFIIPKTIKIYDTSEPNKDIEAYFRDVKIPISFKSSIKSKIINIWLPLFFFFIGIVITSVATMNNCVLLSASGAFIQTIALLKISKNI